MEFTLEELQCKYKLHDKMPSEGISIIPNFLGLCPF